MCGPLPLFDICGQSIEYVEEWPHPGDLGHITSHMRNGGAATAYADKLPMYSVFSVNKIRYSKFELIMSYVYSIYGSALRDVFYANVSKICIM